MPVELLWIPLGTGASVVRASGRAYEALVAAAARRARAPLFHSALEVTMPDGRYAIEVTPVPDADGASRGVVAGGAVGLRLAGRLRVFRYEVRCWQDGTIPDADDAVGGPRVVSTDPAHAARIIDEIPRVPTPGWGRDELEAGEMWNSNSVVSWLLSRAGIDTDGLAPPGGGRAPGWSAGLVVARRG